MDIPILRIIGITLVLLLFIPTCIGNVHEATIFYLEDEIKTGDTVDLEQGYRLVIDEIRKSDAAISIFDGGKEVMNTSISGDYTYQKEIDGIDYDIIRISVNATGNVVRMAIEQYIDPDKEFDYPLISDIAMSIRKGEREPLKEGYELEATSIIDNNAILTLYEDGKIVKQEKLSENGRFIHAKKIDGQYNTILIAKADRVENDSIHISGLSQFKEPESTCSDENDAWNIKLAESTIFRYLLSVCVFAGMLALILFFMGRR
ncbi:MAG: hypothetical protein U9N07_04735 [Euryarchaeota archaeon]|nr:hypothetical protein [Euryarchaeota archaeon]